MNHIKPVLTIIMFFCVSALSAQNYTNDAILIQQKKATAVIKASGIHEKKKEATLMAIKSAFDTYFNYGIEGLNDGKPALNDSGAAHTYIERFFDDKSGKYMSFVANYEEDKNPARLPNKQYKASVKMEIYVNALLKDMEKNGARTKTAAEKTTEEIKIDVAQPTIMVVLYKQQDRSYREILRDTKYVDYRTAIARVQDAFIQKGYDIKDVMAVLEATEKSMLFESNSSVESMDAQLINNSGADVYVTVDAGYNTNNAGSIGSIALVAYERASGKLLASKHSTTPRYQKAVYADLYRIAIGLIVDDFLKDMTTNYAKKADVGNTFVLRISTGSDSATDLNTVVSSQGLPLSDVMRLWLRKNALNGRFHVQGSTRDLIIFDEIQVASKADAGYFIDANDFALDVFSYIQNDLGISCDKRVDGNTIYITIND
ncbi:hypothetical protein D0T84_08690 [Dysgonomonas sp. 521]|uniref:DUF6175 family protein n=1 Tax=Dysgonomonas sp. 521 TaxID=2302932 RepID=UPI0013D88E83|nr:DUF6175 family protein [Dysgonomonas sp. 521]NDV94992.1 hypothetical protein [Dysgonomonas sp. 521]